MNASFFANSPSALGDSAHGDRVPPRLEQEIRKIYSRSPIYGRRFPLHVEPLEWSCYREIPALSKKEIVEVGPPVVFRRLPRDRAGSRRPPLRVREHLGDNLGPMTVIMEDGWWTAQTVRAYRASPCSANSRTAPTASACWRRSAARATFAPTRTTPFQTGILTGPST